MKWIATLVVLALACTLAVPARAQVNTENLRKRVKVAGYTFFVEGSLTADAGNTQGVAAGGGLGAGLASGPHLAFAYGRGDYSRYAEVTSVDKTFAHARYNFEFASDLWGELFAQAQSDAFQRLTLRTLFGLGPRVRVLHVGETGPTVTHELDVYLGAAYMHERDVIASRVGATDASVQIWHRESTYLTAQWQVDDRVLLATTMYVQPALTEPTNVRLLSESIATFKVTKLLAASVSATVRYDSAPPSQVKTMDAEVKNTLALVF